MCTKTKKFIQCRNCPRKSNDGPTPGYYYDTVEGYQVIKECKCHVKWREDLLLETNLTESNIVPDYTFDNYVGTKSLVDLECLKKIAKTPEKFLYKKMIYLYGPNGTQKSSMCQALGKELILKGVSVQYMFMADLISNLVTDFSDDEATKEKKEYMVKRCMDCDLLIIDEAFDAKKAILFASGYQVPYLDQFIRNRFEIGKKSILFVSNVHPDNIADVPPSKPGEPVKQGFGTSLQSLVQRNTKQSLLTFKDVWVDSVNNIDTRGLFGI